MPPGAIREGSPVLSLFLLAVFFLLIATFLFLLGLELLVQDAAENSQRAVRLLGGGLRSGRGRVAAGDRLAGTGSSRARCTRSRRLRAGLRILLVLLRVREAADQIDDVLR